MARRFITCAENCKSIVLTKNPNRISNSVFRERSVVDDFYSYEVDNPDSKEVGKTIKFYRDPLYEIFNQQRLNQIGAANVETWIKSMMAVKNNPLNELREHCSDEELLSVMKSRYAQSPSEIMNWARYLNDNLETLKKEVTLAREKEEQIKQQAAQATQVAGEPTNVVTQTM